MSDAPHILVTGAGGFIGQKLAARLLVDQRFANHAITLADLRVDASEWGGHPRLRIVEGDMSQPDSLSRITDRRIDTVIHLAGVLGGTAEADPHLSRRINLDATLDLFDRVHAPENPPRVVVASSIAVFGPPLADRIDDDSLPLPTMVYGAHKRMVEVALEQQSARGWIDGIAIRLPGIVARKNADARLKSAFLNTIFHDFAAGRPITLPVSEDGTFWLISVPVCVEAFLHAALLDPASLGGRRAMTLPAQFVRMGDLIAALRRKFPDSPAIVRCEPDPEIEALFGRQPPLTTALADALGFTHDGDVDRLVEQAFFDRQPASAIQG